MEAKNKSEKIAWMKKSAVRAKLKKATKESIVQNVIMFIVFWKRIIFDLLSHLPTGWWNPLENLINLKLIMDFTRPHTHTHTSNRRREYELATLCIVRMRWQRI